MRRFGRSSTGQQLVGVVEQLSARADEHLEDEERSIVPLINTQLAPDEWQRFLARGGRFLFVHRSLDSCWPASSSTCVARGAAVLPGQRAAAATYGVSAVRNAHFRRLPDQALRSRRSSADLMHAAKSP